MIRSGRPGLSAAFEAVLAAALFGASAPFAKLLLGTVAPVALASLLYLGSGLGLLAIRMLQGSRTSKEAQLAWADLPWLTGAALAGGVAAPVVLLTSLRSTPAATASLLLNFEGAATALLAALVFREAVGRRVWMAVVAITLASALLSWSPGGRWGLSLGAIGILVACVLWGLDNNLSRHLAAKDPTAVTMVKGLSAGACSFLLAFLLGQPFPSGLRLVAALLLGFMTYGVSIVLFIRALRSLGAARTSAFFGTAPFVGALLSFLLFREQPSLLFLAALPFMVGGAVLLLGERHGHPHHHAVLAHTHAHRHDDGHHTHAHVVGEEPDREPHSHPHVHEAADHTHPHTPDLHHRHGH